MRSLLLALCALAIAGTTSTAIRSLAAEEISLLPFVERLGDPERSVRTEAAEAWLSAAKALRADVPRLIGRCEDPSALRYMSIFDVAASMAGEFRIVEAVESLASTIECRIDRSTLPHGGRYPTSRLYPAALALVKIDHPSIVAPIVRRVAEDLDADGAHTAVWVLVQHMGKDDARAALAAAREGRAHDEQARLESAMHVAETPNLALVWR
jgi:hypothetical protein